MHDLIVAFSAGLIKTFQFFHLESNEMATNVEYDMIEPGFALMPVLKINRWRNHRYHIFEGFNQFNSNYGIFKMVSCDATVDLRAVSTDFTVNSLRFFKKCFL
jgi:hypothetical protein